MSQEEKPIQKEMDILGDYWCHFISTLKLKFISI